MAKSNEKAKRPRGRPIALPGPIGELAQAMGGRSELAAAAGCDDKTVYRWAHEGRVGSTALMEMLSRLFKKHKVTTGVEKFMRESGPLQHGVRKLKLGEPK